MTGDFAVGFGVLTASSAGTATQSLKLPAPGATRAAGVFADVIDDDHGLFGLVIGGGGNRIEWLWNVGGTKCTLLVYSGEVAIVDQDYPGAPAASLEVQIVPNDCSWNIAVFRDGAMVATHDDIAVTFDGDWVPFGVTSNDENGGTWDNLCLRNCHSACYIVGCGGMTLPVGYMLTAGGFTPNPDYSDNPGWEDCKLEGCDLLNGSWVMLNGPMATGFSEYYTIPDSTIIDPTCTYYAVDLENWVDEDTELEKIPLTVPHPAHCGGLPVGWSPDHPMNPFYPPPGLDPYSPVRRVVTTIQCFREWDPEQEVFVNEVRPVRSARTGTSCLMLSRWYIEVWYSGNPGNITAHILAVGQMLWEYFLAGLQPYRMVAYATDVPIGDDLDLTALGELTLHNIHQGEADPLGNEMCDGPETITLTPLSEEDVVTKDYLHGASGCDPTTRCVLLYTPNGIVRLSGTLGGESIAVCLFGDAGYSNGPFTGGLLAADHSLTGPCESSDLTFSLECRRICEGRYGWALVISDGTEEAVLPYEPTAPPSLPGDVISGPIDLCGASGVPFATLVNTFTGLSPEDHPLMRCCDPDIAQQCGLPESLMADATPVPSQFDPCSVTNCSGILRSLNMTDAPLLCSGNPIALTGYSSGDKYFIGDFPGTTHPVAGADAFNGHKLVVWCDGSSMRWARLDADGCVHNNETGAFTTWDCEAFSGTIEQLFDGSQDCCDGFGVVNWIVEVAPNL